MILSPYNPKWPIEFAALRAVYATALDDLVVAIEHIGSTAVPGLRAKPILDIDLVIPNYSVFPTVVKVLDLLGYSHNGDQGIFQREAFKPKTGAVPPLVALPRAWMPHHLYVCPADGAELRRHLLFRNALCVRADLRSDYETIKCSIEAKANGDWQSYAKIKENECREFIERVLRNAVPPDVSAGRVFE
jgi:GrpB-like predicted nucleotidyltransferase (UPF0157 family)